MNKIIPPHPHSLEGPWNISPKLFIPTSVHGVSQECGIQQRLYNNRPHILYKGTQLVEEVENRSILQLVRAQQTGPSPVVQISPNWCYIFA
jgi:hypothetical protein